MEIIKITVAQATPDLLDTEKNMKRVSSLLEDYAKGGEFAACPP